MALKRSDVRLQWNPDHDPLGNKETRKAIQLGLRNELLAPFKGDGIVEIEDISKFIAEQWKIALSSKWNHLYVPEETVYQPGDSALNAKIELDNF